MDFVRHWKGQKTGLGSLQLVDWIGITRSKFYDWRERYGKANEHNALVPRDQWIEFSEREAIIDFARVYPLEDYRRLTFMMLDRDVAAVSPSTTYRILKTAGLIESPPQKAPDSSSRCAPTSTGTSMFLTSTSPEPSTICARYSTAALVPSSITN
jgi:hypothetical protein